MRTKNTCGCRLSMKICLKFILLMWYVHKSIPPGKNSESILLPSGQRCQPKVLLSKKNACGTIINKEKQRCRHRSVRRKEGFYAAEFL